MEDIPRIVELGVRSMMDGPYARWAKINPEQCAKLARYIIGTSGCILLWEENGYASGVLGFVLFDHHFTAERMAQEIMWYVEPEYRQSPAGISLKVSAEKMAKELGAKYMQMSAPNEQVGQAYKRSGYKQMEVMYQVEL